MTIEEALAQAEVDVYSEGNDQFIIDKESRSISIPAGIASLGVESDEKSKRLYFKCPQIVGEGVDLSTFGIKINYQNASSEKDIYICNDVQSDGEYITFSWLLSRKVTKYKGTVQFIVCATKTAADCTILNEWNTTLVKMPVLEGMEPENIVVDEPEMDVINQLLQIVKTTSTDAVKQVNDTGDSWQTKVEKEGNDWHTKLVQEGTAQQEKVSQEGTMQHTKVVQEGTLQHTKVLQEGTDQHAKLVQEGEAQQTKVSQEGTTQQTKVSKEGTAQYAKLVQEGATQQDKIATKGNDVIASIPSEYAELTEDVEGLKTLYTDKANTITNTVTGQDVIVEDSAEQTLTGLTVYGRTMQDTLKGINLLDMSNAKGGISRGITTTVNLDGSYSAKGTKTSDLSAQETFLMGADKIDPNTNPDKILFTLQEGRYFVRGIKAVTVKDGVSVVRFGTNETGTFETVTSETENRITGVRVEDIVGVAGTVVNKTIYPIIAKVTEDIVPPWEKYVGGIPSPNPQYLQELDSIGYIREDERNLFDASRLPTKTQSGVTVTNNGDGSLTVSGTGNTTSAFFDTYEYTKEESKELIKGNYLAIDTGKQTKPYTYFKITDVDTNKEIVSVIEGETKTPVYIGDIRNKNIVVTFGFAIASGQKIETGTVKPFVWCKNMQVPEGYWNPFGKTYRKINQKINGINLADVKGSALINPIENRFIIDGKSDVTRIQNIKVNIKKGKTYTLYYDYKLLSGTIIPSNYIPNVGSEEQYGIRIKTPFVARLDSRYIGIFFNSGQTGSVAEITNVQLVEGSNIYPYQKYYQEQNLEIDTPNGLRGVPVTSGGNYTDKSGQQWICDTIDFKTGVLTERTIMFALNGSEIDWRKETVSISAPAKYSRYAIKVKNVKQIKNSYTIDARCNYFIATSANNGFMGIKRNCFTYDEATLLNFYTHDHDTLQLWKEYLMSLETPLTVIAVRETPLETKLSADQIARFRAVHTNCPVTTMSNDDAADFSMEYSCDLKTYIDNKVASIQQNVIDYIESKTTT